MADHNLDELLTFLAVARFGSYKAAANTLKRDASVISRRITQLEERIGVRLVTRTTRNVILTEAGTIFFRRLGTILDELDSATRDVQDLTSTPQGVLKISLPVILGREVVAPNFAHILRTYPKITLDVHFEDRAVDIVAEGYDLAVRVGILPNSSLVARKLGTFHSHLVASPGYLEENRAPKRPEDLANHACLGFTKHPEWPHWTLQSSDRQVALQPGTALNSHHVFFALMCMKLVPSAFRTG